MFFPKQSLAVGVLAVLVEGPVLFVATAGILAHQIRCKNQCFKHILSKTQCFLMVFDENDDFS